MFIGTGIVKKKKIGIVHEIQILNHFWVKNKSCLFKNDENLYPLYFTVQTHVC